MLIYMIGIAVGFFGLIGARKTLLVIASAHGTIRYRILDDAEDASGFAATLRALIAEEKGAPPSKWGQPE